MTAIALYLDYLYKVFTYWTRHNGEMFDCEKVYRPDSERMRLLTELMPHPY